MSYPPVGTQGSKKKLKEVAFYISYVRRRSNEEIEGIRRITKTTDCQVPDFFGMLQHGERTKTHMTC